ncbi:MAG: hypothetical protein M5U28_51480 [Sandaracinaceae bacterium]|nr:hypothetical protein [Sandaracinaceae bacterium]
MGSRMADSALTEAERRFLAAPAHPREQAGGGPPQDLAALPALEAAIAARDET